MAPCYDVIVRILGLHSKTIIYGFIMAFFCCWCLLIFYRKVHILGSFQNIKMARTAICNLILGKTERDVEVGRVVVRKGRRIQCSEVRPVIFRFHSYVFLSFVLLLTVTADFKIEYRFDHL